jgi:sorbitol/mannitol transport system substrate-binding protein
MKPISMLAVGAMAAALVAAPAARATNLVIATVDNAQMLEMQRLTPLFERAHPGIHVAWVTLSEHTLRNTVSTDIETGQGQFDIVTVGLYETPLWARRGWLAPIEPDARYDVADLLPSIRAGLSYHGQLYAAPFYGESSMLMYRTDLLRKAGLQMPAQPRWSDVAALAARLDDRRHGVYGICLRGKAGWGENMTLVSTIVNAYGGQWFDMDWHPRIDSAPWKKAVGLYVDLLRHYGPPDAAQMNYNANLALFAQGKCAMWVGATVAGGFVSTPAFSRVAGKVGFAPAPVAVTARGSHWLWAWALAIPADIAPAQRSAAQKFVNWATSRAYVESLAEREGWDLVPSGTRRSTYANPAFQAAAPWAAVELAAIDSADPNAPTLPPSPYRGIQFVSIPGFRVIGDQVGAAIRQALLGKLSVEQALAQGQYAARRELLSGGYPP